MVNAMAGKLFKVWGMQKDPLPVLEHRARQRADASLVSWKMSLEERFVSHTA
jgi:hypothetical protein